MNICNILQNGLKFVPCLHQSSFDLFKNLLNSFENELLSLNKKILISKVNNSLTNVNLKFNIDYCNSLDCFYNEVKKLNSFSNSNNVYLLKETIDFRFEFFKNISNIKIEKNLNLNENEIYFLKEFVRKKPFKITDCDKNVGICIMSNEIYNSLVLNQLSNSSIYVKIDNITKETISKKIDSKLHDLNMSVFF